MRMIIDMWRPQGATSRESEILTVQPNRYLPFQIQFFEQFGAASLRLEWSLNGGAYSIIPREVFYINKELCSYKFNFNYVQEIGSRVNSMIPTVNPDIQIVRSIAPSINGMNWSPYNFSSYASWNCPCWAYYRLVYSYNNNILSLPSNNTYFAQNCPTYCNPSLTFNLNMSNVNPINDISNLRLILQVNTNGTWVNSQCPPMPVSKSQSTYVFNCLTTQSQ
jgi:hypothetical protein